MKVVIDSTVLVSMFSDKDKFHKLGSEILSNILDKRIEPIIPTLALLEACGLISRQFGKHFAEIVEDQLNTWINNGMFLVKELTLDRMRYATEDTIEFGLKGADAVFVELAKETGSSLATFDEDMKKRIKGKIKLFKTG